MKINESETLALHKELVKTPSVSGNEKLIADFVESWMRNRVDNVHRIGNSVVALYGPGPYLLLNSHLDTVPECEGWSRDPYDVEPVDGVVYGLGSNDAKGAGAALMAAFDHSVRHELSGSIALVLVEGEETSGKGTSNSLQFFQDHKIGISAAIVGEPTGLDIAVAQKGLLILEIIAESTPCHAARATQLGVANPIAALANDIAAVCRLEWPEVDAFLGPISLQPTVIKGGSVKNQVPGLASVTFDIRSTNAYSHDEIIERFEKAVDSRLNVVSTRLTPASTSDSSTIVRAASSVRPGSTLYGSATMSDMVFMQDIPSIKAGPGISTRSHTPDEFILEEEILAGAEFYIKVVQEYLRLAKLEDAKQEVTA